MSPVHDFAFAFVAGSHATSNWVRTEKNEYVIERNGLVYLDHNWIRLRACIVVRFMQMAARQPQQQQKAKTTRFLFFTLLFRCRFSCSAFLSTPFLSIVLTRWTIFHLRLRTFFVIVFFDSSCLACCWLLIGKSYLFVISFSELRSSNHTPACYGAQYNVEGSENEAEKGTH